MKTTGTGDAARSGRPRRSGRQRHHEQAVRPLRLGERAQVVVSLLDRLDVVDDEVELAVGQDSVDAAEPLGGLRTGQERDDDADGQGPPEAEASGRRARREPELLHHRQDPVAGLRVDDVLAVEGPRRGGDADAGLPRDVPDGHGLPRHGDLRLKPVTWDRLHHGISDVKGWSRASRPLPRPTPAWCRTRASKLEGRDGSEGARGRRKRLIGIAFGRE